MIEITGEGQVSPLYISRIWLSVAVIALFPLNLSLPEKLAEVWCWLTKWSSIELNKVSALLSTLKSRNYKIFPGNVHIESWKFCERLYCIKIIGKVKKEKITVCIDWMEGLNNRTIETEPLNDNNNINDINDEKISKYSLIILI